jgi:hypothetical protein
MCWNGAIPLCVYTASSTSKYTVRSGPAHPGHNVPWDFPVLGVYRNDVCLIKTKRLRHGITNIILLVNLKRSTHELTTKYYNGAFLGAYMYIPEGRARQSERQNANGAPGILMINPLQ